MIGFPETGIHNFQRIDSGIRPHIPYGFMEQTTKDTACGRLSMLK
jgi:hypothetical protein